MDRHMVLILIVALASIALSGCSSGGGGGGGGGVGECEHILMGTPKDDTGAVPTKADYAEKVKGLDMTAVQDDMKALLKNSKDCWPADWDNYGPFMVRLAWHCAGTYRKSDGVGGCGGGRQRFEPERSWPDNTNLDKARALVYPLKEKYGDALSWGDLFILAGTVAIREAGMPLKRMCFGREDEENGARSDELNKPCEPEQGNCSEPWGATTVGLIYVNPEGPMGIPDPAGSVKDIRRTFGTMGHSDRSTVALIGGGHAIGKAHGACTAGAGNAPKDAFEMNTPIWKGGCGSGVGEHTVTSGFEGAWTTNPLKWDNEFFTELLANTWEKHIGPGGHNQWRIQGGSSKNIFRLTSDIALLEDPAYKAIVQEFADDSSAFNDAFDTAWYDLTTTNVGGTWSAEAKCDDNTKPSDHFMRADDGPQVLV